MTSQVRATLSVAGAFLLFAAVAVPIVVAGQTTSSNRGTSWTHPKTPWGEPDIEGRWPVTHMMGTPLQRAEELGIKAVYTDAEMAARATQAAGRGNRYQEAIKAGNFGAALQAGVTDPGTPQRQTSMIVDPPNGRLPELTAEGKRQGALMKSSWTAYQGEPITWDAPEDFDTWDRCITRGMPASMFPFRYNGGMEIFQSPGYVVLSLEMIHEDRIIPTDGRAALPASFKTWMGEARGRWEGNTLVVETTHFNGRTASVNFGILAAPAGNRIPTSPQMTIVERFTRVSDDTMHYEITTTDPVVYTQPWTARFPLKLTPDYQWWEYACHEGNRTIRDFITSSRAERAAQGAGTQPAAAPAPRPQSRP
jgi:hypothetical protein